MIYARVHNHTVAEDYYSAMERVEKRLGLALGEEGETRDVKVQDLLDRLSQPGLGEQERLEIAEILKSTLDNGYEK
jgi:hypothetical protein